MRNVHISMKHVHYCYKIDKCSKYNKYSRARCTLVCIFIKNEIEKCVPIASIVKFIKMRNLQVFNINHFTKKSVSRFI